MDNDLLEFVESNWLEISKMWRGRLPRSAGPYWWEIFVRDKRGGFIASFYHPIEGHFSAPETGAVWRLISRECLVLHLAAYNYSSWCSAVGLAEDKSSEISFNRMNRRVSRLRRHVGEEEFARFIDFARAEVSNGQ